MTLVPQGLSSVHEDSKIVSGPARTTCWVQGTNGIRNQFRSFQITTASPLFVTLLML